MSLFFIGWDLSQKSLAKETPGLSEKCFGEGEVAREVSVVNDPLGALIGPAEQAVGSVFALDFEALDGVSVHIFVLSFLFFFHFERRVQNERPDDLTSRLV